MLYTGIMKNNFSYVKTKNMPDKDTKNTIPAVDSATRLVEVLSLDAGAHTVTELAERLDISVTTCFRILHTLENADWIYRSPQGGYHLSAGLIRLLTPVYRYQLLVGSLKPHLAALSEATQRSVKISVRQGDEAVTIHRVEFPHPYSLTSRVGARFALPYGSSGTALLLDFSDKELDALLKRAPAKVWQHQAREDFFRRLEECRSLGHCRDFGGFHPSIYTLSAPVRNAARRVECSVTLLGLHEDFMDERQVEGYRRALAACVEKAEKTLATQTPPVVERPGGVDE